VMEIDKKAYQLGVPILVEACTLCMVNRKFGRNVAVIWTDNISDLMMLIAQRLGKMPRVSRKRTNGSGAIIVPEGSRTGPTS
ncbi:MAG: hypothetical protein ACREIC_15735, partial [Limisphaerales bacterium]